MVLWLHEEKKNKIRRKNVFDDDFRRRATGLCLCLFVFLLSRCSVIGIVGGRGGRSAGRGSSRGRCCCCGRRHALHLIVVPVSIGFECFENVLSVGCDQIGPGLPQRMSHKVDETNLSKTNNESL